MSPVEGRVDVLIIGAGPAGLMCATALARAGVTVRIIDKRRSKITAGHADGLLPRTMEVLQSYGLADRIVQEGSHMYLWAFYRPDGNGGIECTERVPFIRDPLVTHYPFTTCLSQAKIEAVFIDSMNEYGITVERAIQPTFLEVSEDIDELSSPLSYPVKVTVDHLDEKKTEIIHAKYVVGADGAHSWVRNSLGIRMEGEQTDVTYGVIDIVAESNFPDIRNAVTIQSLNGSCLLIPREGDSNRLYIQLSDGDSPYASAEQVDRLDGINPQKLLSIARKILHPYELAEPKVIEWWSTYSIGQRLASSYSVKNRVFIAGDACHTHSPKAGQGMNAGMNDTHNLAWKLVQVLKGWSSPSLLETYEYERRKFAQDLIDFDKKYAALFARGPKTAENEDGVSPEDYFRVARENKNFITGFGIHYPPSAIVDVKHQKCAENLIIGQRMLPQMFIRAADVRPVEIHHLLPSNTRFKLLFFVGKPTPRRAAELDSLTEELSNPSGFLQKYSPDGHISTVFDIVTIIAGKKYEVNHLFVPGFFRPHWSNVLLDDVDTRNIHGGQAYERFAIDPEEITLVVIRPDGYVGTIIPRTAMADLETYFSSFLVPRDIDY